MTIHGANLSLSIPHDVRNYRLRPHARSASNASGWSTAASSWSRPPAIYGYRQLRTKDGAFESYTAFSITDPGNADGVITVGATHRYCAAHLWRQLLFEPRTDRRRAAEARPRRAGRAHSRAVPDGAWGDLDGTSMAAPHVSGAAAMLMARYSELIGQAAPDQANPVRQRTDLGRERNFQGHGMLDVLRALQSQ